MGYIGSRQAGPVVGIMMMVIGRDGTTPIVGIDADHGDFQLYTVMIRRRIQCQDARPSIHMRCAMRQALLEPVECIRPLNPCKQQDEQDGE